MAAFDYGIEAELFPSRDWTSRSRCVRYRRFANAAEAIRFAIEDLPPRHLLGPATSCVSDQYRHRGDAKPIDPRSFSSR